MRPRQLPRIVEPATVALRSHRLATGLAAALALAVTPASQAGGVNVPVANCNDAGPGSLREAAANAVAGSTIDMSALNCSLISLTGGAIHIENDNITVQGPGSGALTIDGNNLGRVLRTDYLYRRGLPASTLTINAVTITGGVSAYNGGCILANSNLVLSGTVVTGCSAGSATAFTAAGGAIDALGNVSLLTSTVTGNTIQAEGPAYGGGIIARGNLDLLKYSSIKGNSATSTAYNAAGGGAWTGGGLSVKYSDISDNAVSAPVGFARGGGLAAPNGTATIGGATISGNSAESGTSSALGGGMQVGSTSGIASPVDIDSSTISGNIATSACSSCLTTGGGVQAFGSIAVADSTIRDNHAISTGAAGDASGGGLATRFYGEGGRITVVNTTLSGNDVVSAAGGTAYGGGMAATQSSPFTARNSTVAFNRSSGSAGGISVGLDNAGLLFSHLESSIVARNSAPSGADIAANPGEPAPFFIAGGDSLVMDVAGVTAPPNTISVDPVLLPLANYGGNTATHALAACSPAIDAGNNNAVLDYDQRGEPYARVHGTAADMGAFELQPDADLIFRNGFEASPCP